MPAGRESLGRGHGAVLWEAGGRRSPPSLVQGTLPRKTGSRAEATTLRRWCVVLAVSAGNGRAFLLDRNQHRRAGAARAEQDSGFRGLWSPS